MTYKINRSRKWLFSKSVCTGTHTAPGNTTLVLLYVVSKLTKDLVRKNENELLHTEFVAGYIVCNMWEIAQSAVCKKDKKKKKLLPGNFHYLTNPSTSLSVTHNAAGHDNRKQSLWSPEKQGRCSGEKRNEGQSPWDMNQCINGREEGRTVMKRAVEVKKRRLHELKRLGSTAQSHGRV